MYNIIFSVLWLGVLAWMDIRRRHVPVWLLVISGMIVTSVSAYEAWKETVNGIDRLCGIFPGGIMLLVAYATNMAGWADGVILLLLGLLTGFREIVCSFILSMLIISTVSLILVVLKRANRNTKLPYLPFLFAGYLVQGAMRLGT